MDINKDFKAKSSLKMNLGLGSNPKSNGPNQVERLRRELEEADNLLYSLRAELDQKERRIATLALSGCRVSSHGSHDLQKIVCNPALHLSHKTHTGGASLGDLLAASDSFQLCQFWIHFHLDLKLRSS